MYCRVVEEAILSLGASVGYFAGDLNVSLSAHQCNTGVKCFCIHPTCTVDTAYLAGTSDMPLYGSGCVSLCGTAVHMCAWVCMCLHGCACNCSYQSLCGRVGDTRKLLDDCAVLQPTVFCAVPRVYERVYSGVMTKVGDHLQSLACMLTMGGRMSPWLGSCAHPLRRYLCTLKPCGAAPHCPWVG
jgi:hypothetical protein